ncbi:putative serine/threonine-protein phosphatase C23G10.1 [Tritrichomonas foetus]|uniref:Serine/threonine-protein phosphatase n=1 Tax=Tritrichomonas foetus TaxID=1144522 RepID=A0A1J4KBM0_9EUKA|nr:putative serine/threonine-protein phosphatase C23G10.1 [Tritrichomonas foetus]|eukprot:OHT07084.1 putative serine/threonine-protein phosphatase C23G10.1 [Tritrichomonas foetus]
MIFKLFSMNIADYVLEFFGSIFTPSFAEIQHIIGTEGLPIPIMPKKSYTKLCTEITNILKKEASLLEISGQVVVVGDLHGSFLDFVRILKEYDFDQNKNIFLFLGDYVDRGNFSLEILTVLYALKVKNPHRYYLIRGNHEFEQVCSDYGFKEEINSKKFEAFNVQNDQAESDSGSEKSSNSSNNDKKGINSEYNEDVFKSFLKSFSYLPLAAVVNNKIFCVHGGLSPYLTNLNIITKLQRPIQSYSKHPILEDMVWADLSSTKLGSFITNSRGSGITFSETQLHNFLKATGLKAVVRGHQFITSGVEYLFDKKFVTVFSASFYKRKKKQPIPNKVGVLIIDVNSEFTENVLESIEQLSLSNVVYKNVKIIPKNPIPCLCMKIQTNSNKTVLSCRRMKTGRPSSDLSRSKNSPHPNVFKTRSSKFNL